MEPLDDQIQASWPGGNSVSGAGNACTGLGRNHNQTLVGAGRSPPTARCGCSRICFCIPANPRSRGCERRPQDKQRVPRLLTAAIGMISTSKEPDNEDYARYCRAVAHIVTGNTDDGPRATQQECSKGAGTRNNRRP